MSTLIKCVECGKNLSSLLEKCSHCSKKPIPEICRLCEKPEKPSLLCNGFHASCFTSIQNTIQEYSIRPCSVCNTSLDVSIPSKSCPECGHPISRETCYFCQQSMFGSVA